jgi:hypothetical protein
MFDAIQVTPEGVVTGPEAYLKSEQFKRTKRSLEDGTHVLLPGFNSGTPAHIIARVIFQTDYAAWRGAQEMTHWTNNKKNINEQ